LILVKFGIGSVESNACLASPVKPSYCGMSLENKGQSLAHIAEEFGVTRSAVQAALKGGEATK
jgi:hypothetical protein